MGTVLTLLAPEPREARIPCLSKGLAESAGLASHVSPGVPWECRARTASQSARRGSEDQLGSW